MGHDPGLSLSGLLICLPDLVVGSILEVFVVSGGAGVVGALGTGAGVGDLGSAGGEVVGDEAGARGGERDTVVGSGGALGGLPLLGLAATGVSSSTAAGWQFSQWCLSTMSSPLACLPVMTSSTDLPTRRRIGKGPCLIVSKGCPIFDFPLLMYTWVAAAAVAGQ